MLNGFLSEKRRNYRSSSNALRISLSWQFRSTYWPDDHFNMNNCDWIMSIMTCSTQNICNQSCWSDFCCSRSVDYCYSSNSLWISLSWQFRSTYWPDDHFNMNNLGGLSGQCPVPHKKAIISHLELISLAEASKLSFLQPCIENFTFMAIPKDLLTGRSPQHEQFGRD